MGTVWGGPEATEAGGRCPPEAGEKRAETAASGNGAERSGSSPSDDLPPPSLQASRRPGYDKPRRAARRCRGCCWDRQRARRAGAEGQILDLPDARRRRERARPRGGSRPGWSASGLIGKVYVACARAQGAHCARRITFSDSHSVIDWNDNPIRSYITVVQSEGLQQRSEKRYLIWQPLK